MLVEELRSEVNENLRCEVAIVTRLMLSLSQEITVKAVRVPSAESHRDNDTTVSRTLWEIQLTSVPNRPLARFASAQTLLGLQEKWRSTFDRKMRDI